MIQDALANNMTFGKDGEDVTEVNIGVKTSKFNKQAALATVKKTFDVARGNAQEDDRDDLIFQRVYSADDFITEYIDSDLDAFVKQAGKLLESGKVENTAYLATPLKRVGRSLADFMSTSSLVEDSEENNPIHLLSTLDKVTLLGKGGITGGALENAMKPRNLRKTGINRLDPVHTPESGNIGLVNHLTQDASIKEGTIFTKFYKVKDGKASTADNNIVELSPKDEYGSYVAFYDMRHLNRNNKELEFTTEFVPARYRGQLIEIDKDKIQYIDRAPQNIFDVATNLVPFGHHNDGNRMLMGANMQTQAVNIINREEPLVQVAADVDKKKTFEEVLGDKAFTVKSPVNGTVEDVKGNMISIKDDKGKTHEVKIYDYFPLNRNNFINNEPTVKVGDKVKKDQLIAEGWQTRNGKLALGLNARVAYMPFKGYNYEDGVVVSDKFAERMMTEELITDDVKIREDHVGGPGSSAKKLMLEYLSPQKSLDNLDDDGIIKEGTMVKSGDILVARLKKVSADTLDASRQLYARFSGQSERYRDASEYIPIGSYRAGKVTRVVVMSGSQAGDSEAKYVIKITIAMQKPLKFGDKIAGRHGNKGTITEILPESEMPKAPDGKPIEVIYSPLAIPSRKNPGQLYEVNAGLIAEKKNQPFKVVNFDPTAKDEVLDGLKEIGIPDGKMELIDPETGKPYDNPVTVGNMYIMKLKHKVDDKIQARSGIETQPNLKFMDPVKQIGTAAGEKHNPQTLGEMEMWVMQANKAVNNILEATTLKSDGAGDIKQRAAIFRALAGDMKFQDLDDFSSTPASLKILDDTLTSMGFKMTPLNNGNRVKSLDDTFGELMLSPMKADEMIKLIGKDNEVVNAKKFEAKPSEIDNPEPGGLYDTKIFGKAEEINDRNKWGYIKLTHPIPNPIFMKNSQYNPYSTLLTQFSSSELSKIMDDPNLVVITNPGDTGLKPNQLIKATEAEKLLYEEGKKFEWKVSGDAILHYLKQVDVNKELKETESALKRSKGSERDKLYAKYRVLKNLKVNNIKPEDLMLKVVPVSPVYMRPMIRMGKNVLRNDLTTLYSDVIIQNNASKETLGDPDSVTASFASS
jgi:DNA-directed RNA polymerase subunit beta